MLVASRQAGAGSMGAERNRSLAAAPSMACKRAPLAFGTGLLLSAVLALTAMPTRAQEAQAEIGLEQMSIEDRVARLETLHDQMRTGVIAMQDRVRSSDEVINSINDRIARGDQPLVALEIEQLWVVVNALQKENSELRERLQLVETDGN